MASTWRHKASAMKRFLKAAGLLALAGAGDIAALLVALWVEHRMPVTVPAPTGFFAVDHTFFDAHLKGEPLTISPARDPALEIGRMP